MEEGKWYFTVFARDEETGETKVCVFTEDFVNTVGYEKALELCLKGYTEDVNGLKFDGVSDYVR